MSKHLRRVFGVTVLGIKRNLPCGINGINYSHQHQLPYKMNGNGATTAHPLKQMLLRSQGSVDQLDTTQLNPAGRYIRSYHHNGQCNVNASYHTVSLQIKERPRAGLQHRCILGQRPTLLVRIFSETY